LKEKDNEIARAVGEKLQQVLMSRNKIEDAKREVEQEKLKML